MSIRIKKKSKFYKILEESSIVDLILFGFLGGQCLNLLLLDKIIHHQLMGRVRHHIKQTIKNFSNVHSNNFKVLSDLIKGLKISKTLKGQTKIHIPLYFQIKQLKKCNFPLSTELKYNLSYSYQITKNSKQKQCAWNSQFYFSSPQYTQGLPKNRTLWLYKESHSYAEMPCYLMDVMTVHSDDVMCIMLPFYNWGKQIDKLKFYALGVQAFNGCDCQVEALYTWADRDEKNGKDYADGGKTGRKKTIDTWVDDISNAKQANYKVKTIKYSTLENHSKIQLQFLRQFQQTKIFDCLIKCVSKHSPIKINLKKKGCYNDEANSLQVRQGDTLILYCMRS